MGMGLGIFVGEVQRIFQSTKSPNGFLSFTVKYREYMGKNPETGEARYDWLYVECQLYGPRAQAAARLVKEGQTVHVEGRPRVGKVFNKQDGTAAASMVCLVNDWGFATGRNPSIEDEEGAPAASAPSPERTATPPAAPRATRLKPPVDDDDLFSNE